MTFSGDKYMTRGIQAEIPVKTQMMMWSLIEKKLDKLGKLDYLQIFNLIGVNRNGKFYQRIIHSQEQPKFKYEIEFEEENTITEKVYVIDDESHVTMLLASEY